jgi:small subunit ribosomal protein S25e
LRRTNLGGGKKKLSFAQMEKAQEKKPEKRKETKSSGSAAERKIPDISMPDATSGKVVDEVKKLKVLTPYAVASRFNVRISVAKDFLDELEKRGAITLVSRGRNVRVYKTSG